MRDPPKAGRDTDGGAGGGGTWKGSQELGRSPCDKTDVRDKGVMGNPNYRLKADSPAHSIPVRSFSNSSHYCHRDRDGKVGKPKQPITSSV